MANNVATIPAGNLAALPEPMKFERVTQEAHELEVRFWKACQAPNETGKAHCYHELAVIDGFLPEVEKFRPRFEALVAPATKRDLANHLGVLVKSFPNAGRDNAEIYGRMLLEDVGAQQPSVGAVEAACRHLRRTSTFLPTIAEVLNALGESKKQIGHHYHFLTKGLPYRRESALKEVEKRKEWDAEMARVDARRAAARVGESF